MFPTLNSNSIFLYMSFTCVSGQMYVFPVTVALEVKYKNELLEKKRNDHVTTVRYTWYNCRPSWKKH